MKIIKHFFLATLCFSLPSLLAQADLTLQESRALAEEFGSLRNAQVAIDKTNEIQKLTYFATALSEKELKALEQIAPNLTVVTGLSEKEALARAEEAHGVDAKYANPNFIAKATNLKWVKSPSAGVDRYLSNKPLMESDSIILTNFRATHGPSIADHVIAMLLFHTRNLRHYDNNQEAAKWSKKGVPKNSISLKGKTMLVIGLGGIGSEIAQRAHGFDMRVIGTRRSDTPSADFIEKVGKPKDLLSMLPEADVVVLAVPLTPETTHLLDEEAFKAMKNGSYLINIARGKVIDTNAMLSSLKSGKLAGVGLDVTDPEPLPSSHPLWKEPFPWVNHYLMSLIRKLDISCFTRVIFCKNWLG